MADYREGLHLIPAHMRDHVEKWILHAEPDPIALGGFLYCVLTNDLMGAFARGDEWNLRALPDWVMFLYNFAPSNCYGSPAQVEKWSRGPPPEGERAGDGELT